jgi:hypothetical protein
MSFLRHAHERHNGGPYDGPADGEQCEMVERIYQEIADNRSNAVHPLVNWLDSS